MRSILALVQSGKIVPADGARLIQGLRQAAGPPTSEIAIIGMSGCFPGAADMSAF